MEFKDYYKILGVEPNTSTEQIKKVYRKLARRYHPDVSKEENAEHKFKEVNEAWEVLKDEAKRKQYDALRAGGYREGQEYHPSQQQHQHQHRYQHENTEQVDLRDFSDFFSSLFGGRGGQEAFHFQEGTKRPLKGRDIHAKIKIPLNIAFQGGIHPLHFAMSGTQQTTLNVTIPKGVQNGSQIRLKGKGEPGLNGGASGDLYCEIEVLPFQNFKLVDKDIHLNLPIAPWEAALGATIPVPTLEGVVNLKIPAGSRSGHKLRLKEKGLPGTKPGSQIVTLLIQTPKPKNEEEKDFYEKMAEKLAYNPREELGV
jgi:curved DNA-binding protein